MQPQKSASLTASLTVLRNEPIADTITCSLCTLLSYHPSVPFRAKISSLQKSLISHVFDARFQVEEKFGCLRNSRGFIF